MRKRLTFLLVSGVLACFACVTINVYFPEAEIKDLSQVIEEQVRKQAELQREEGRDAEPGGEPDSEPESGGDPGSDPGDSQDSSGNGAVSTSGLFDLLLGTTPAYAQSVADPGASSPAIRAIINSRAARLGSINDFKARGFVGEAKTGLIEARQLGQLTDLKARAELNKLIRDENADRQKLYKEIAVAKGVDGSQIPRIVETYAATLRSQARAGDWIQTPDGNWSQK